MLIMKFGGRPLSTPEKITAIGNIVESKLSSNPLLILSAIGETTENLLEATESALQGSIQTKKIEEYHKQLVKALSLSLDPLIPLFYELRAALKTVASEQRVTPKMQDHILSFGERLSVRIFSAYLRQRKIRAQHLDGWEAGIVTNSNFTDADVSLESYDNIRHVFHSLPDCIPVVTGFIAKDACGNITTLGRGGSDFTAVILAIALGVQEVEFWKDVPGIMSTDPHLVQSAKSLPCLSFEELEELTYFGAKVLHPKSVKTAKNKGIAIRIKHVDNPLHPGTLISPNPINQTGAIVGITHKTKQTLLTIHAKPNVEYEVFISEVFRTLNDLKITPKVFTITHSTVSLILENNIHLPLLEKRLTNYTTITCQTGKTLISLVGKSSAFSSTLENALRALNRNGICIQMFLKGISELNTNLVVNDSDAHKSIYLLHREFIQKSPLYNTLFEGISNYIHTLPI